jgi:hypothetical protein
MKWHSITHAIFSKVVLNLKSQIVISSWGGDRKLMRQQIRQAGHLAEKNKKWGFQPPEKKK